MSRKEDIERVIEKLRLAWLNCPEQRLCQLIWNIASNTRDMATRDCFHVRDTPFEIELNKWYRKKGVAQKT